MRRPEDKLINQRCSNGKEADENQIGKCCHRVNRMGRSALVRPNSRASLGREGGSHKDRLRPGLEWRGLGLPCLPWWIEG